MNSGRIPIDDALTLKEEHDQDTKDAQSDDWLDGFSAPVCGTDDDECEACQ